MLLIGGAIVVLVVIALVFALTYDYAAPIAGGGDMKQADQDARMSPDDDSRWGTPSGGP